MTNNHIDTSEGPVPNDDQVSQQESCAATDRLLMLQESYNRLQTEIALEFDTRADPSRSLKSRMASVTQKKEFADALLLTIEATKRELAQAPSFPADGKPVPSVEEKITPAILTTPATPVAPRFLIRPTNLPFYEPLSDPNSRPQDCVSAFELIDALEMHLPVLLCPKDQWVYILGQSIRGSPTDLKWFNKTSCISIGKLPRIFSFIVSPMAP